MAEFRLVSMPGKLCPGSKLLEHSTAPVGPGAKGVDVTEVHMLLELEPKATHMKQLEYLFPGTDIYCKTVAGLDHAKGEDRTARTKLEDNISLVLCMPDGEEFARFDMASIKSRPQLKINDEGDAKLIIRPHVRVPDKMLPLLVGMTGADMLVSVDPAQQELPMSTTVTGQGGDKQPAADTKAKGGKGGKTKPPTRKAKDKAAKDAPPAQDDPLADHDEDVRPPGLRAVGGTG